MSASSYFHNPRYHTENLSPVMNLGYAYYPLKSMIKLKRNKQTKKTVFQLSRLSYHILI